MSDKGITLGGDQRPLHRSLGNPDERIDLRKDYYDNKPWHARMWATVIDTIRELFNL